MKKNKIESYIITGHRGLIGQFLNERLEKKLRCVHRFDQEEGFHISNLEGVKLRKDQKTDLFVHTAAYCKINETIKYPLLAHLNNAIGTFHALEFCRHNKINKFMNFSSSRVLSKERNPYVASKIYGEELAKAYKDCYGIEYINIQPSTVYGPAKDKTSRLMTDWCQLALKDKELPIYGNAIKTLDFTHVDDFNDGIEILLDNWQYAKNDDYAISGNNEVRLDYLADLIIHEACGGRKVFKNKEIAQPQKVKVDTTKLENYGYKPKISIEEGVKQMVDFYRK